MTDRFTRGVHHEVSNRHFTCGDERCGGYVSRISNGRDGSMSRPSARPAVAPYLTLLSLQGASVSCAICQSPSSFRQFVPSSSAIRKPDRSLSSAWGLSLVSLQFLSRRLPLSLQSLP